MKTVSDLTHTAMWRKGDDTQRREVLRDATGQLFGRTTGVFDPAQCRLIFATLRKWGWVL